MNVLIVCHGNINRSAAGEIILNRMKPAQWNVRSAGLKTKPGRITAKKMRDALAELGYEQTSIRSTPMTPELAAWADSIMYMDATNEFMLIDKYIDHSGKFLHLGSLINEKKIPDPNYAKDNTLHKKVIGMLEQSLKVFIGAHT